MSADAASGVRIVRAGDLLALDWAGTGLLLDASAGGVPGIVHFGRALGLETEADVAGAVAAAPTVGPWVNPDSSATPGPILEARAGWRGLPGVAVHREGRGPASSLRLESLDVDDQGDRARIRIALRDAQTGIAVDVTLEALPSGLLALAAELTNTDAGILDVAALRLAVPIPLEAGEVLDFAGHWIAERRPQRRALVQEAILREHRRGRTGHDAVHVLVAGTPGFGFGAGEVWAAHLGWSGDAQLAAQRDMSGLGVLTGGELLAPGEIRLAPGERYATPTLYAAHGIGLDEVALRFHDHLRELQPAIARPRPVTVNSWEAVYYEQTPDTLWDLLDRAHRVGAERFVVDDGWYSGRVDDHRSLGDWTVDARKWPEGLGVLADRVHALGMEFGLWFEPEMISPDSELARAHPDWILGTPDRTLLEFRFQAVLDLANPEAYAALRDLMDERIRELGIDYIKWDHNRDLVDAVAPTTLRPRVHEQTLAAYRLMAELQDRHPGLEIEACSSGGGRVDLGVLRHTQRIWDSDTNDPFERQRIQRWTSQLVPLAMQGAHVAAPIAHTTGRATTLSFRAGTALFGHFGIEWDLTSTTDEEFAELAAWVAFYKEHRALLHSGVLRRFDHPDDAIIGTAVIARDGGEALVSIALMDLSSWAPLGRIRIPGLDPARSYRVVHALPDGIGGPEWPNAPGNEVYAWPPEGLVARGSALGEIGLTLPVAHPADVLLLHLTAAD